MDRGALNAMAQTVLHILEMRAKVGGRAIRSYNELFALACRKVDEIAPLNVSTAAQKRATKLHLGDLRNYCWHCSRLSKHRAGKGRLFLWEHYKPVADIKRDVLALGPEPQLEQITEILGETKIVWVLRKEGIVLGNTSRPNPPKTYSSKGVSLLYRWVRQEESPLSRRLLHWCCPLLLSGGVLSCASPAAPRGAPSLSATKTVVEPDASARDPASVAVGTCRPHEDTVPDAVVETVNGVPVRDPFRWLEKGDSPRVKRSGCAWNAASRTVVRRAMVSATRP